MLAGSSHPPYSLRAPPNRQQLLWYPLSGLSRKVLDMFQVVLQLARQYFCITYRQSPRPR